MAVRSFQPNVGVQGLLFHEHHENKVRGGGEPMVADTHRIGTDHSSKEKVRQKDLLHSAEKLIVESVCYVQLCLPRLAVLGVRSRGEGWRGRG